MSDTCSRVDVVTRIETGNSYADNKRLHNPQLRKQNMQQTLITRRTSYAALVDLAAKREHILTSRIIAEFEANANANPSKETEPWTLRQFTKAWSMATANRWWRRLTSMEQSNSGHPTNVTCATLCMKTPQTLLVTLPMLSKVTPAQKQDDPLTPNPLSRKQLS